MQVLLRSAAFVMTVALLTACGGGGDGGEGGDEAAPTTTEEPTSTVAPSTTTSTTTTVAPVDPSVVPDDPADITPEYVEAVLAEHNRVIGDALRLQLEGADPAEVINRYNAIYVPEAADFELSDLFDMTAEERARYRTPPGDGATQVTNVLQFASDCIVVEVLQSAEGVVVDPPEPFEAEIVLQRSLDKSPLNETAWLSSSLTGRTDAGSSCPG